MLLYYTHEPWRNRTTQIVRSISMTSFLCDFLIKGTQIQQMKIIMDSWIYPKIFKIKELHWSLLLCICTIASNRTKF